MQFWGLVYPFELPSRDVTELFVIPPGFAFFGLVLFSEVAAATLFSRERVGEHRERLRERLGRAHGDGVAHA